MKKRNINILLISLSILILITAGALNLGQYIKPKNPDNKNLDSKNPDFKKPDSKSPDIKNPDFKSPDSKNPYSKLEYQGESSPVTYRFPGEFENQQAIWMQWPSQIYNESSHPVNPVMINIIKAFDPYIRVNVASQDTDEIVSIENMLKQSGYTGSNVHFYVVKHLSIWARDVGPIFVKDSNNKFHVVDFVFNNYSRGGSQYYIDIENQVHKQIANLYGYPLISTNLISEGGAIESNGKGTLMLTESVALKRNSKLTKQEIENEYKRVLGVSKIIWLKKGLAEDDSITTGHINEIARFANPDTILLAQVLPADRYTNSDSNESYLRLEENYDILQNATDQDGKSFKIIRVPMPPTIYQKPVETGKIPVRSYLNYAVTNNAVLMQTYWRPGRSDTLKAAEDDVKAILEGVFPGRDIVGIDSEALNLWGGGIHCVTQHMPE